MEYKCKVSLIGNEKVGKTSLILRYINNSFSEEYLTTLGADFIDKVYTKNELPKLDNKDSFNLVLWDMAGQAHFKEIATIYCAGSAGIMIIFDVTDIDSFNSLPSWVEFSRKISDDAIIIVVGNKMDLQSTMSEKEIKEMEKKISLPIHFVSAKNNLDEENSNVKNVFEKLAEDLLEKVHFSDEN